MKKIFSVLFLLSSSALAAGNVALVYDNEAAVSAGQSTVSPVTPEGIVVSAKWVLANNATMRVGIPGEPLKKGVLLRLDAKSDMALIYPGDVVSDEKIQKAYQERARSFSVFVPASTSSSMAVATPAVDLSTSPYKILINGQEAGSEPVVAKVRLRKAELNFELIRLSTSPVWYFDMELTSEPKLSFWKKGKNQSLTEVPTPKFTYSQQVFFKPLANGRSVKIPVEAYFMEEGSYTISFVMKSKGESYELKIPVVFKEKI